MPNFNDKRFPAPRSKGAPVLTGRPKREKVIGREDVMDLVILLNTCDSVEEFLAKA